MSLKELCFPNLSVNWKTAASQAFAIPLWHESKRRQMVIRVGRRVITQPGLPRTLLIYICFSMAFVSDSMSQFEMINQMITLAVNDKQVLKQPYEISHSTRLEGECGCILLFLTLFKERQQLKEAYIQRLHLTLGTQMNREVPTTISKFTWQQIQVASQ